MFKWSNLNNFISSSVTSLTYSRVDLEQEDNLSDFIVKQQADRLPHPIRDAATINVDVTYQFSLQNCQD